MSIAAVPIVVFVFMLLLLFVRQTCEAEYQAAFMETTFKA
jgi:hypothetical protein